jgi:hypothetical protein
VFRKNDYAMDYAQRRACYVQVKFRFSIRPATLSASFRSMTRIETCDAVIGTQEPARDLTQTDTRRVDCADFSLARFWD